MILENQKEKNQFHGFHHYQTVHIWTLFLRLRLLTATGLYKKKSGLSHYGKQL